MKNYLHSPLLVGLLMLTPNAARAAEPTPQEIFERRIMPIFRSPNPSSCTQCHLAGVDLKNYVLPSHEKTFRSLRDQGLIDLKEPEKSKILRLINMREENAKGAALIHEKTRQAEYEAFAAWIKACCDDPKLRDAPALAKEERAEPSRPVEVIRHARKDRLLESFERNVWAYRFRCMSCHNEGTPENDKLKEEHGPRVAWFKAAGAEATMNYLLRSDKLIDVKEPAKSLLLLKPLGEVKHGGGKKFLPGDLGYKGFRAWLEDYAAIVGDQYARAEDLPKPADDKLRFGSDAWLKLNNTPPEWGDKLLRVTLYAWDADKKTWETEPVAFSDRGVWGKGKLWQHNLTLLTPKGADRTAAWQRGKPMLPPGRYLVKVHVDFQGRMEKDWKAEPTVNDYAGQAEIEARWAEGYGRMTVVEAAKVKK
jgi:hypothetical protein